MKVVSANCVWCPGASCPCHLGIVGHCLFWVIGTSGKWDYPASRRNSAENLKSSPYSWTVICRDNHIMRPVGACSFLKGHSWFCEIRNYCIFIFVVIFILANIEARNHVNGPCSSFSFLETYLLLRVINLDISNYFFDMVQNTNINHISYNKQY